MLFLIDYQELLKRQGSSFETLLSYLSRTPTKFVSLLIVSHPGHSFLRVVDICLQLDLKKLPGDEAKHRQRNLNKSRGSHRL